jgi:hypothetical protein
MGITRIEKATPTPTATPTATQCKHKHWRIYQSLGYRECDQCKIQKPIFNVIRHQR